MKVMDEARSTKFDIPIGSFKNASALNKKELFNAIKAFSIEMFRYWTEDNFASKFRKMLTLEQYRNPEMAQLLKGYLIGGVIGYAKELISESAQSDKEAEVLALEYFAPIYMLMNLYEQMDDKENVVKLVEKHIDYFIENL